MEEIKKRVDLRKVYEQLDEELNNPHVLLSSIMDACYKLPLPIQRSIAESLLEDHVNEENVRSYLSKLRGK